MSAEIDWVAALAEVEKKIAKLQVMAEGIKEMISSSGGSISGSQRVTNTQEIPSDAFLGLSTHDATKKYLEMARSDKTARQIAEALQQGGLRHATAKTVYTAMWRRRSPKGDFAQPTENTWGLAEWYRGNLSFKRQSKASPLKAQEIETEKVAEAANSPTTRVRAPGGVAQTDHCENFLSNAEQPLHVTVLVEKLADVGQITSTDSLSTSLRKDSKARFENLGKNTWALRRWPEAIKVPFRKKKEATLPL